MKIRRSAALAALVGLGAAAGFLLAGGQAANAATTVPYEPDPQSYGTLSFYDASGNQITSGSTNTAPMAAYVVGSAAGRTGDTTTLLNMAQPNPSATTANWNADTLTGSTSYPLTSGPANIVSLSQTHPVSVGTPGDFTIANFIAEFPNDPAHDTNTSYQNLYQLRLITAAGANQNPQYQVADILVSGNTWTQVYPTVATPTSTTLTASANPVIAGQNVTLTATQTPAAAGSVQFKDGSSNLGTPVTVNASGVATLSTSFSTTGPHSLSAVFTPTDTTSYSASTGTLSETVNPPATPTSTTLAVTQNGLTGSDVKLVANVNPAAAPGSVAFFDNGSTTAIPGTVTQNPAGTYTLDLPSGMSAGSHSIVATFTPSDATQYEASSSQPQAFALQAPPTGACAQNGSHCTTAGNIDATVPVGTLVISTPYTGSNILHLGQLALVNNGTLLQTAKTIAANATQGITVTDTRSGNLPYSVTALATPLQGLSTSPAGTFNTINPANLGLTGVTTDSTGLTGSGAVTPVTNPAAAGIKPSDPSAAGLNNGGSPVPVLSVDHGLGTLYFGGTLTLNAPTATAPGTYTGTITFTVG